MIDIFIRLMAVFLVGEACLGIHKMATDKKKYSFLEIAVTSLGYSIVIVMSLVLCIFGIGIFY